MISIKNNNLELKKQKKIERKCNNNLKNLKNNDKNK